MNELIDNFLKNSEEHIESIKIAIANKSSEDLKFPAHTLKGSSKSLGILKLSEQCSEIQQTVQLGDWEKATNSLKTLQNLYILVRKALEDKKSILKTDVTQKDN